MGISNPGGGGFTDILKFYDPGPLAAPGRFNVTAIPGSYSTIHGKAVLRSDAAVSGGDNAIITFNDDTTQGNYRRAAHFAGSTHLATGTNDISTIMSVPAASDAANYWAIVEFWIEKYASTMHYKAVQTIGGDNIAASNTGLFTTICTTYWESLAAIASLTVEPDGFQASGHVFAAGSWLQVWLYK